MDADIYDDDYFYEGAISPGEEFELFTPAQTDISERSEFSAYYALYMDNFTASIFNESNPNSSLNYFDCKHVLVSKLSTDAGSGGYVFPENTKITMLDKEQDKFYYYIVTANDVSSGKFTYEFSDFIEMGSNNGPFDEEAANQLYYHQDQDAIYENFIFHVDFKEAEIPATMEGRSLLIELRDQSDNTVLDVLGIQREPLQYNVYKNSNSNITIDGEIDPLVVYLGEQSNLTLSTNFVQTHGGRMIFDTPVFNYKMGLKMSIYDVNDNQLSGEQLLGLRFLFDGMPYYPRMDGSIRMSVADKLSNVLSRVVVDTGNNTTIPTGTYRIRIEAFGSPDRNLLWLGKSRICRY